MSSKKASALRQELDQLLCEIEQLGNTFSSRKPMWEGNVYVLRRRCGRPNCHCVDGKMHETTVLSDRSENSPRTITLKGPDIDRFQRMTEQYTKFRKARARVTKITKRILILIDKLAEIRLKEGKKKKHKKKVKKGEIL